jgi:hypothetical protein
MTNAKQNAARVRNQNSIVIGEDDCHDMIALLAEAEKVLSEMWSIGGALCQPMAEAGLDGRWESASERYHDLLRRMGEGS